MAIHMKAQFEAMGLAVIVILISLGMIFVLYFSFDQGTDVAGQYGREQRSQNIINALLQTNVEDCEMDYADVVEDAAVWKRNPCGSSMDIINETTQLILNHTLTRRGESFAFRIMQTNGNNETELYSYSTCTSAQRQRDSAGRRILTFYPAPTKATVTLSICYEGRT